MEKSENWSLVAISNYHSALRKSNLPSKYVSDYAQTITKDESQRQALLQVVQEHRKLHPGQSKSNFLNTNSVMLQI